MADYIEREYLLNAMENKECAICSPAQRPFMCGSCPLGSAFELVEEFPAADVQPVVHGKWVNDIQCSNCGWYMEDDVTISPMMVFFDYCPHCGAKMDLVI